MVTTTNDPLKLALALITEMLGCSIDIRVRDAIQYGRDTPALHNPTNYDILVGHIYEAKRNIAGPQLLMVLCPNCNQQVEVDGSGKFMAHKQYGFPCPESGSLAPKKGWESE